MLGDNLGIELIKLYEVWVAKTEVLEQLRALYSITSKQQTLWQLVLLVQLVGLLR